MGAWRKTIREVVENCAGRNDGTLNEVSAPGLERGILYPGLKSGAKVLKD